jgi:hypothetical protein
MYASMRYLKKSSSLDVKVEIMHQVQFLIFAYQSHEDKVKHARWTIKYKIENVKKPISYLKEAMIRY